MNPESTLNQEAVSESTYEPHSEKAAYEPHSAAAYSESRLWPTLRKPPINRTQKEAVNLTQKAVYEPHLESRLWTTLRNLPMSHT